MRKILFLLCAVISSLAGFSRSYDEKIAEAMNTGDWFALDSIYKEAPKEAITDFLEVYGRCMIGNRFNRPEVSIPAFEELLENHSKELSLNQMVSAAIMCAIDLSRVGENAKAVSVLTKVRDGLSKDGQEREASVLEKFIRQYSSLTGYNPYQITFEGDYGNVPFTIVPVGKPEEKGVHIHLEQSAINGIQADIMFDTGAGVNIISESMVEKYDMIPIDVQTTVSGAHSHNGSYAIAREMKIGNIIVRDVPFYVMDITSNNEEANQYMQTLSIIVGSDLMLQLKDLTIDFENSMLIVPSEPPSKTGISPNLCFSPQMNLLGKCVIQGDKLLMNIDTGDSSYGTLGKDFYKTNKKLIKTRGLETTIRKAGIGGVEIAKGYKVPEISLELGGNMVTIPSLDVMPKSEGFGGYECTLGLKSLMLYKGVRFNLVDFVLSTEPLK